MTTGRSRIGLLAVLLGACASPHESQLDGPIDYALEGGFVRTRTSVHLELDGSASKQVTTGTGPTMMTSGTVSQALLDALRSDLAAVDLVSLRDTYSCSEFACGADFPVATRAARARKRACPRSPGHPAQPTAR